MPKTKCEHEWTEDEMFKSGAVMMFFGGMDDFARETRMICKKCGAVDYKQVKPKEKIDMRKSVKKVFE